ncbi:LysR family transcriptional regulator [Aureimonas altamirensis]|uniref:LysR family transcriptional regulator n=1 Tax=Aureimonas altamirensis TaxID=370622 RepID=A0A0B1PZB7_9HYPH|nr:LysR family transcriptional regulator [Aureimonas altamirensis]KHJ53883.1 LysR family transcriptional regulator [Aureimonas altamirensis]
MELLHLKYAVAVARNGSFSAASQELCVQQPMVSRRIRSLEEEIGAVLFNRSTAGARLTPIGEDFVRMAQRILDDVQSLANRTRASIEGKRGRVALGFYKSLSGGELRSFVRRFRRDYQDIQLDLLEMPFGDLIAGLNAGKLDAAILLGDSGRCPTLQTVHLWSEHLVVALPEGHRLAEKPVVFWPDLKGERFLVGHHDPGPDIHNILLANLAAPSDRPDVRLVRLSRENILAQVADGEGVSLQCEAATGTSISGVAFRQVHNGSGATRLGYIACWHPDTKNPVLQTVIDALKPRC